MSDLIITQACAFCAFLTREPLALVLLLELGRMRAGAVA